MEILPIRDVPWPGEIELRGIIDLALGIVSMAIGVGGVVLGHNEPQARANFWFGYDCVKRGIKDVGPTAVIGLIAYKFFPPYKI